MPTLTETREDIFRRGLKNAKGTVIFWKLDEKGRAWGTVKLDGPIPIEYRLLESDFTEPDERELCGVGSRIVFRMAAGIVDDPDEKTKPRVTFPHLIFPGEDQRNFNL